jgi:hypothetical protein
MCCWQSIRNKKRGDDMVKVRNLTKQSVVLEMKVNGKIVGRTLRSHGDMTISMDAVTQDMMIKADRGVIAITPVADVTAEGN